MKKTTLLITTNLASRSIVAVLGGVILLSTIQVTAQDWPQWRGPKRDGTVAGFAAPEKWPSALTQKWKTTVGTGDATPALAGQNLYVFARQESEEVILCLNAADGKELWRSKYEAQTVTGPAGSHPGPRSSPTLADGKVVTLGVGGVLGCWDAATGKEVWRKDEFPKVVPQFFAAMSPIVVDGLCIAHLGAKENSAVLALDLATGNTKWKWTGDGPGYASPVLLTVEGSRQVVVQTEKSVVGLALSDGKLLWQVASPTQGMSQNAVTPVVDGQMVIYTGQGRGTKAVKVEKQGDGFAAKELWSAPVGTAFNTPVLKGGFLFGLADRGNFFCLNAKTGQEAWTATNKVERFGAILDAGPVLLALAEKSGLIAYKPSDKQYEELARIKVSDTPIYAHPVVSGKRVFIKDKDSVTLWMID